MIRTTCFVASAFITFGNCAQAYEIRCRFVFRVANSDIVLPDNQFGFAVPGNSYRFRVQFGVFDDASGPAPEGGFLGWNTGSIVVSGLAGNSEERRTPGRLGPFAFPSDPTANGNPPLPGGDPFRMLTDIDATLGPQAPTWVCDPDGSVPAPPGAFIRGRNTWQSVFEFTSLVLSNPVTNYTVTFSGNLVAASEWATVGTPMPPNCGNPNDPSDDVPGIVTYEPMATASQPFECALNIIVPGMGSGAAVAAGLMGWMTRRRR